MRIAHNTDNLPRRLGKGRPCDRARSGYGPERIALRPVLLRHCLVDDRHARRCAIVLSVKMRPAQQRNFEVSEVSSTTSSRNPRRR